MGIRQGDTVSPSRIAIVDGTLAAADSGYGILRHMTDKLKELLAKAEHWPQVAQEEAIASLEAIEEDFVVDGRLARDLERARQETRAGQGTPQEELFERFGL